MHAVSALSAKDPLNAYVHRVSDGLYCKSLHSRALVRNDSLFPDDGRKYYPVRKVEPWKVSMRALR